MTKHTSYATVVTSHRSNILIEDEQGNLLNCPVTKKSKSLVCGDRITFLANADQSVTLQTLLPRKNLLERHSYKQKPKPLAANLDQIIIVNSVPPGIDTDLIDRYLVAAQLLEIKPLLVFNKQDLLDPQHLQDTQSHCTHYAELGYQTIWTSTETMFGLDDLQDQLSDRTNVLVGKSGVGKSSLIQSLIPDLDIRIGAISEASGQGRHTTTQTILYRLAHGGALIDSPGVRQFGLWQISQQQAAYGYIEFQSYVEECRFSNCTHTKEPGCAVLVAVAAGKISQRRLKSYYKLLDALNRNATLSP